MATITPGYLYSPTELVTPGNLDSLVRQADISGINWSDMQANLCSIGAGTAPSLLGYAYACFEVSSGHSLSGYDSAYNQELNYLINSPYGWVALFKFNGFESNRFRCRENINAAVGVMPPTATHSSASLAIINATAFASTYDGVAQCIGIATATGATNLANPRIVLRGFAHVWAGGTTALSGATNYQNRVLWGPVLSPTNAMAVSTSTAVDKILGLALTNHNLGLGGNANNHLPCFLAGGPIWRILG
jgi:hypothetical protein